MLLPKKVVSCEILCEFHFSDVSEPVKLYSDVKLYKFCLQKQFWQEIRNSKLHAMNYKKLNEIQNSKYFIGKSN